MPVNWKNLGERAKVAADKAKDVVEKRGGTEGLKRDADELKKIATGEGSIKEKAQKAATALKEPGAAKPKADAGDSDPGAAEAPTSPPPKQASPGPKQASPGAKQASPGATKKASAGKAANQPAGKPKQTR
jgi:hypothetical protein